jgi:hypothetical protein
LDNARNLWALSAETLEITDGGFQKWGIFNSWMVLHWEIEKNGGLGAPPLRKPSYKHKGTV